MQSPGQKPPALAASTSDIGNETDRKAGAQNGQTSHSKSTPFVVRQLGDKDSLLGVAGRTGVDGDAPPTVSEPGLFFEDRRPASASAHPSQRPPHAQLSINTKARSSNDTLRREEASSSNGSLAVRRRGGSSEGCEGSVSDTNAASRTPALPLTSAGLKSPVIDIIFDEKRHQGTLALLDEQFINRQYHPRHIVCFTAPPAVIAAMPSDSRLFLGNLASEKTSKHELARMFAKYGNIIEIMVRGSYGFIQYDNPRSCIDAIKYENGRRIGGLSLDLSVSKNRDHRMDKIQSAGGPQSARAEEETRRGNFGSSTGPDRHERHHHRSRPYESNASYGRHATFERRPSSAPVTPFDGPISPIAPRARAQIPEVQILVLNETDRSYIWNVETSLKNQSMAVEVAYMGPKMSLPATLRQLELEGVLAAIELEPYHSRNGTLNLLIFAHRGMPPQDLKNITVQNAMQILVRERDARRQSTPSNPLSAIGGLLNSAHQGAQLDQNVLLSLVGLLTQQLQQQNKQQQPQSLTSPVQTIAQHLPSHVSAQQSFPPQQLQQQLQQLTALVQASNLRSSGAQTGSSTPASASLAHVISPVSAGSSQSPSTATGGPQHQQQQQQVTDMLSKLRMLYAGSANASNSASASSAAPPTPSSAIPPSLPPSHNAGGNNGGRYWYSQ